MNYIKSFISWVRQRKFWFWLKCLIFGRNTIIIRVMENLKKLNHELGVLKKESEELKLELKFSKNSDNELINNRISELNNSIKSKETEIYLIRKNQCKYFIQFTYKYDDSDNSVTFYQNYHYSFIDCDIDTKNNFLPEDVICKNLITEIFSEHVNLEIVKEINDLLIKRIK